MTKSIFFRLYPECVVTNGYSEGIICLLSKGTYFPISKELILLLNNLSDFHGDICTLKKMYDFRFDDSIDAFCNLLVKRNIGFFNRNPDYFDNAPFVFDNYSVISNCLIVISDESTYDYVTLMYELEGLGCDAVELRFENIESERVFSILSLFDKRRIKCFDLVLKYNDTFIPETVFRLYREFKRIRRILVHSCSEDLSDYSSDKIYFRSDSIVESNFHPQFVINNDAFAESQRWNLALNRKICFDHHGYIYNYISHAKNYGKVCDYGGINRFLSSCPDFKAIWAINNDLIDCCCDCQYRYICYNTSDIVFENSSYRRIERCSFDPYNNVFL